MSNLLKEKCTLTLLRAKLEEKREREYWNCKGFRHLAYNCRSKEKGGKEIIIPQNKYKVLRSRVI